MLNYFTVVFIILILFILIVFKKKYIFNVFKRKKLHPIKKKYHQKIISSSVKDNYIHYQNNFNKYSEFYKRTLRGKMLKLSKGSIKDKLKALEIAEELADKSTLPVLRKGLKDINLEIVERSADLIRKFK